jgi:hypothetical protein
MIISIHFNKFETVDHLKRALDDNNIDFCDAHILMDAKKDGYTKVFLDVFDKKVIGFVHKSNKKDIIFCSAFTEILKNMKSIDINREPKVLSIDSILDKINERGINSLTNNEKIFLAENSK